MSTLLLNNIHFSLLIIVLMSLTMLSTFGGLWPSSDLVNEHIHHLGHRDRYKYKWSSQSQVQVFCFIFTFFFFFEISREEVIFSWTWGSNDRNLKCCSHLKGKPPNLKVKPTQWTAELRGQEGLLPEIVWSCLILSSMKQPVLFAYGSLRWLFWHLQRGVRTTR